MTRSLACFRVFVPVALALFAVTMAQALAQDSQGGQPPKDVAIRAMVGDIAQPSKDEALRAVAGAMVGAPAAAVSACSLCYSCGGDWPVFSGVIPTRSGAKPWERGPACSGALAAASDSGPYLCCRR